MRKANSKSSPSHQNHSGKYKSRLLHLKPSQNHANKISNQHTNRITPKWHRHSCLCSDDLAHKIRAPISPGSSPDAKFAKNEATSATCPSHTKIDTHATLA